MSGTTIDKACGEAAIVGVKTGATTVATGVTAGVGGTGSDFLAFAEDFVPDLAGFLTGDGTVIMTGATGIGSGEAAGA